MRREKDTAVAPAGALKPASEGAGPLLQRDYWAVVRDCRCSAPEVAALVRERFPDLPPALVVFTREDGAAGPLQVGERLGVSIKGATDTAVRVVHADDHGVTVGTVAGHPEAGRITFGAYPNGRRDVASYAFSDPRIVIGHFDPEAPLRGRVMLLEMRALRALRYLSGVVVSTVREDEADDDQTAYGFRYDTLEGHIECSLEWFLLTKVHRTGDLRFRIEAFWRPGQFPNRWSRLGFAYLGPRYQREWHHRAHALMARLVRDPAVRDPEAGDGRLAHADPAVVCKRFKAHDLR